MHNHNTHAIHNSTNRDRVLHQHRRLRSESSTDPNDAASHATFELSRGSRPFRHYASKVESKSESRATGRTVQRKPSRNLQDLFDSSVAMSQASPVRNMMNHDLIQSGCRPLDSTFALLHSVGFTLLHCPHRGQESRGGQRRSGPLSHSAALDRSSGSRDSLEGG
jgi:hypothetical protein